MSRKATNISATELRKRIFDAMLENKYFNVSDEHRKLFSNDEGIFVRNEYLFDEEVGYWNSKEVRYTDLNLAFTKEFSGCLFQDLTSKIIKDIDIRFDGENPDCDSEYSGYAPLMGFHTLPNGLTFFGSTSGGDWEWPVLFIIYHSKKQLRAYVPRDGNLFNTSTMEAYGNQVDLTEQQRLRRPPEIESDIENYKRMHPDEDLSGVEYLENFDLNIDIDKIIADITSTIIVVEK